MSRNVKMLIYIGIGVLAMALKANASTFLECKDKSLTSCKEVSKGQAVKILALDPSKVIIKQDQVEFSDKGTLKNKS